MNDWHDGWKKEESEGRSRKKIIFTKKEKINLAKKIEKKKSWKKNMVKEFSGKENRMREKSLSHTYFLFLSHLSHTLFHSLSLSHIFLTHTHTHTHTHTLSLSLSLSLSVSLLSLRRIFSFSHQKCKFEGEQEYQQLVSKVCPKCIALFHCCRNNSLLLPPAFFTSICLLSRATFSQKVSELNTEKTSFTECVTDLD